MVATTADRIRKELSTLVDEGRAILKLLSATKLEDVLIFATHYQRWYTRSIPVVTVLLPDRLDEFRANYERDARRKSVDAVTYCIQDLINGIGIGPPQHFNDRGQRVDSFDVKLAGHIRISGQIDILESAETRLDDILSNLRGILQASLFDSEIAEARYLLKNGHLRAAGALSGVVLEGHLRDVCTRHSLPVLKKNAHISDFNEALRAADIIDLTQWRWLQRLADIRNLCDHKKQREPTVDEVEELLDGVDKAIKVIV